MIRRNSSNPQVPNKQIATEEQEEYEQDIFIEEIITPIEKDGNCYFRAIS